MQYTESFRTHALQSVIDSLPSMICYIKLDYSIITANSAFILEIADNSNEIFGKHIREVLDELLYSEFQSVFDKVISLGQSSLTEHKLQLGEDMYQPVQLSCTPDLSKTSKVEGLILKIDKVAPCAFNCCFQSSSQLSLKQDASAGRLGTIEWNILSNEFQWSQETDEIFAYELRHASDPCQKFLAMIHQDDRLQLENLSKTASENRQTVYSLNCRIIWPDQSLRHIRCSGRVIIDANGQPIRISGIISDETEEQAAKEKLIRNEERLALVLNSIPSFVSYVDHDMRYQFVNKTYCDYFNRKAEDFIGLKTADIIGEQAAEDSKLYFERAKSGKIVSFENPSVHNNGSQKTFDVTYVPDFDETGEIRGFIIVAHDISQRKQTEQELQESRLRLTRLVEERTRELSTEKEFLNALLENISDGIVACDASGNLTIFNRAARDLHSIPIAKIPYEQWSNYYGLYKQDGVIPMTADEIPLIRALKGEEVKNLKAVIAGVGCSPKTVIVNCQSIQGKNGEKLGAVAVMHDITSLLKAEEECQKLYLEQLELSNYRTLAESIPQLAWIAEADGKISWFNKRWYDYTGGSLEEMKGQGWFKTQHPDFAEEAKRKLEAYWKKGEAWEETLLLRKYTGEYRWFLTRAEPIKDSHQQVIRWFGTNTDITDVENAQEERVKLLQEIESKSRLLETVLEQMPIGLIIADAPSGKIKFFNYKILEIWGHPSKRSSSVEEYQDWIAFHPDGRRYESLDWPLARAITHGEVIKNEDTIVLRGNNSKGVFRINAAPVRNQKGEIVAALAMCEDVTDLKRSEKELIKAKEEAESANRLKSAFLANMSHEIRTPIGIMIGFAELLANAETDEERREYADVMKRNGQQISVLINDILDLSKVEAGRMELQLVDFSIFSLLKETLQAFYKRAWEKQLSLALNIDAEVPEEICSDPVRIKQILWNLIANAIKFTDSGSIQVKLHKINEQVIIDVSDTGIGISAEQQQHLFRPFTQFDDSMTRKHGGTGLGLALSQKLAELLGGSLQLWKSEVGHGSTFRLTLKDQRDAAGQFIKLSATAANINGIITTPDKKAALSGTRILVVDDTEDNRTLIMHFLKREGAIVDSAADGAEGVMKALAGSFDVVLMDIQMPVQDGYESTRSLRQKGFNKPVIALTAHAMAEIRTKCLEAGYSDYLTKPISAKKLISTLKQHTANQLTQ